MMVHIVLVFVSNSILPLPPDPGSISEATWGQFFRKQLFEFLRANFINEKLCLLIGVVANLLLYFWLDALGIFIWVLKQRLNCIYREIWLIESCVLLLVMCICWHHWTHTWKWRLKFRLILPVSVILKRIYGGSCLKIALFLIKYLLTTLALRRYLDILQGHLIGILYGNILLIKSFIQSLLRVKSGLIMRSWVLVLELDPLCSEWSSTFLD